MSKKSKLKWEDFIVSKEYIMWEELLRVCKEYQLTEGSFVSYKDLGGLYWEPLLDRILKLAVFLKMSCKLKEIKMNWIRPIQYFGEQTNGYIIFDGHKDKVYKGATANAAKISFNFPNILNAIYRFETLNETNFKDDYKNLKNKLKTFMKVLSEFVKSGWRILHEHVKYLLKPLRDLRRAGYRLFTLEEAEKKNIDITMFNDKSDFNVIVENVKTFMDWEKFKLQKDVGEEGKLQEFNQRSITQEDYIYHFRNEVRDIIESKKNENFNATMTNFRKSMSREQEEDLTKIYKELEIKLKTPNIQDLNLPWANRFRKEAYQIQFEEGLKEMLVYLVERSEQTGFTIVFDTHKIFVNIRCIPNGKELIETKYYIDKLNDAIYTLKLQSYEMKLNGLARMLLPITLNTEIINTIRTIYDLHLIIEQIMGDYLLAEQYSFFYNKIKFINDSNYQNKIKVIQNSEFMKNTIPKYIIYESLRHSSEVLHKMILNSKDNGIYFKRADYYQLSQHELSGENNKIFYAYEFINIFTNGDPNAELTDEQKQLIEVKNKYDNEIQQFGRFWIMENMFNKQDKELWYSAIEQLENINETVREDIRDYILNDEKLIDIKETDPLNESMVSRPGSRKNSKSNVNQYFKKNSKKNTKKFKHNSKRTTKRISTLGSSSSFEEQITLPENLDTLRPPNVWNYPIQKVRELKNEKNLNDKMKKNKEEIRNVDPLPFYFDQRVNKFMDDFHTICDKTFSNWKELGHIYDSDDIWNYFFIKILDVLDIKYNTMDKKNMLLDNLNNDDDDDII